MAGPDPIRWGVLGTANIVRGSFAPGLREAGGGVLSAVAGRDIARTEAFSRELGFEQAVDGYARLLDDPRIDAVYIPLPNTLHAEWTVRALEAGKAVLTEKPLCVSGPETEYVLAAARRATEPLWEAFVFPFHPQTRRVQDLIAQGAIGEVREIQASLHFRVQQPDNIRLNPALGGGALFDVGCYPLHLGTVLFGQAPQAAQGTAHWSALGVDIEDWGILDYAQGRHLLFSCGLVRTTSGQARIIGDAGEIRLSHPFHPHPDDTLERWEPRRGVVATERLAVSDATFAPAIAHIHAVLGGDAEPEHLAVDDAWKTAKALDLMREAIAPSGPDGR